METQLMLTLAQAFSGGLVLGLILGLAGGLAGGGMLTRKILRDNGLRMNQENRIEPIPNES